MQLANNGGRSNLVIDVVHNSLQRCGKDFLSAGAFELADSFLEFADFCRHGGESFRERIVDLFGIGDDDTLAFAKDDMSRNADDGRVRRDISEHYGARSDAAVLADGNVAEDLGASSDHNVVFDRGMPFPVLFAGSAERDALI